MPVGVLQCTTAYPCPPEKIGLNLIPFYRERYGCWVGLSDHSATIYPGLAGAALGMDMLEVHVALSREMFGPDVIASVTTAELRQLVDGVRFIERMRAQPGRQGRVGRARPRRCARLFTRSLVAPRGAARRHGAARASTWPIKKPGTGLPPERLDDVIGRRLRAARRRPTRCSAAEDIEGLVAARESSVTSERSASSSPRGRATRASAPRCRRSSEHRDLELQLVVAASALLDRYGNAVQAIERDGFRDRRARLHGARGREPRDVGQVHRPRAVELATVFDNLKPDAVVTVADRYETLATAVAASYMNIPVVHVQGGEVTGSIDEKVRHAVTKLANLHLVSTELARRARHAAGRGAGRRVIVTGCPSIDIAAEVAARPALDFDPFVKYGGVGPDDRPVEGLPRRDAAPGDDRVRGGAAAGRRDAVRGEGLGLPVLWFWPNVDAGSDGTSKGIRVFREKEQPAELPPVPEHVPRGLPAPARAAPRRSSATRASRSASARSSACRR